MEPLIGLLIDELVMSKMHAQQVLKLIVECIGDQLAATGTAKITGLGTFSVERHTVKFRPTPRLCAKINSAEAA